MYPVCLPSEQAFSMKDVRAVYLSLKHHVEQRVWHIHAHRVPVHMLGTLA